MAGTGPKYSQIVDRLLADIGQGLYSVGDRLPTEQRLMDAYGVSRHTVRQALQNLKQMGVVDARQGRGWSVVSGSTGTLFVERIQSVEAMLEVGGALHRQVVRRFTAYADADSSEAFGIDPGRELIETRVLRYQSREEHFPVAYLRVWIDPLFESVIDSVETDGRTIAEIMVERFGLGLGSIRQTVTASALDAETAKYLGRPVGEAALQIERRYAPDANSSAFLRIISTCRGDLVELESHFQSEKGSESGR